MNRAATIILLAAVCVSGGRGDENPAASEARSSATPSGAITESADEIPTQLRLFKAERMSPSDYGPFEPYFQRWDSFWQSIDTEYGLSLGLAYTTLFQGASKGSYSGPRSGGAGDVDFLGRWTLIGRDDSHSWLNEGMLGFNLEYRHKIGASTPAEIGPSLGSLWKTTTGFNEQDLSVIRLWWQQEFFARKFAVRAGKLDLSLIFDAYRFNSANYFFTNQAFADNPSIPFPERGLGAVGAWYPDDHWFLIFGAGEVEGQRTATAQESMRSADAWFSAATAGRRAEIDAVGENLTQLTVWHTDPRNGTDRPSATGASLVIQQEIGSGWVPYARYAYASDAATDTKQIVTAGAVLEEPFGRIGDRFGLSVGWGEPHDAALRSQWVAEAFYRFEPLREFQITPGVQVIGNPSRNRADDAIALFSLRARFNF